MAGGRPIKVRRTARRRATPSRRAVTGARFCVALATTFGRQVAETQTASLWRPTALMFDLLPVGLEVAIWRPTPLSVRLGNGVAARRDARAATARRGLALQGRLFMATLGLAIARLRRAILSQIMRHDLFVKW